MSWRRLTLLAAVGLTLASAAARAKEDDDDHPPARPAPAAPKPAAASPAAANAGAAPAEPEGETAPAPAAAAEESIPEEAMTNAADTAGYSPPDMSVLNPSLRINGYVDIGFARATGNGTSFSPNDTTVPLDYGADTFATAVNSRGDVASTNAGGQFTNGFLPHSMGIGGHAAAFINVADLDVSYAPATLPLLGFVRLQGLPRFSSSGDSSSLLVEQAFVRVIPTPYELSLTVGKSDSVFGIEYNENESPLRAGVTPSLIARYTTGQMLGAKLFYRVSILPISSAISFNLAATANGTLVDTLSPPDTSQTGRPIFAGRFGYELHLSAVEIKLGASGEKGPRNDQSDPSVQQWLVGADARIAGGPLELRGEFIHIDQDAGGYDKVNGLGAQTLVSGFVATGGYGQLALHADFNYTALHKITIYGRYERRHAQFEGFRAVTVDRITAGIRLDLWTQLALKTEGLLNRELEGEPDVDNNVWTNSLIYSW